MKHLSLSPHKLSPRKLLASVAVFMTLIMVGSSVASAESSPVITEGVGSSMLQLGMSRQEVLAAYPDSFCASGAECFVPGAGGFVAIHFANNTVTLLEYENANGNGWETAAGVQPDSTLEEVAAIYGVPVADDRVVVEDLGYAAQEITDYLCSSKGCQVSGSHLRHSVFADGGPTTGTMLETQGDIVIENNSRRALRKLLTITVTDASGAVVATENVRVVIPGRGSWVIDPDTIIDTGSASTGTYSWTATYRKGRKGVKTVDSGTFEVVEVAQP